MSSLYVANENGDWWVMTPGDVLFVMHKDQMPNDASDQDDKFERVIMQNGTAVEVFMDLNRAVNVCKCRKS